MNKITSIILFFSLIILCFSGCSTANDSTNRQELGKEATNGTNGGKGNTTSVTIDGELDKNNDLVVTLIAYLEQYFTDYELIGRAFFQKVDDIKNGIQPWHVAFDPTDYYFVCGYYNSSFEYGDIDYSNCNNYTWVAYKSEAEIKEYYNGMKWAVVFQINRALTITDIISSERTTPNMEHFQIYEPAFENGVNVNDSVVFDESFIYLNYPNCYLNHFSQNTSTMYYSKSIYYHSMNSIPCVYLDGEYYLSFYLYTVYSDGRRGEENDYAYSFGMYYDTLMNIMEKDKYHIKDEYERTSFYGIISFNDFLNGVFK